MAKVKLIVFYSAGFVAILATGLRIIFAACGAIVSDPSVSITYNLYTSGVENIFHRLSTVADFYPIDLMFVAPQFEAMNLHESIRQVPLPYEIASGQALSADSAATGDLAQLLIGIGGCSPY